MMEYEALQYDQIKQQMALHCCFSLTKELFYKQQPQFDFLWIQRELTRLKEALMCCNTYERLTFATLYDVKKDINKVKKGGVLSAQSLYEIAAQQQNIQLIQHYQKQVEAPISTLQEIMDSLQSIHEIAKEIQTCILPSYEVDDKASNELYAIRKQLKEIKATQVAYAQRFIQTHSDQVSDTITTMRNNRLCVLVHASCKNQIAGFIHGESVSKQSVYMEPQQLVAYNNQIQSLISKEEEEIYRILKKLSALVKTQADAILANQESIILLDYIFAKAMYAKTKQGCIPKIQKDVKDIYLKQAFHPLIDENKVIKNTYRLQHSQHVLLISGSNTGGKTVTLKTIGLSICMMQSGFPVLAEEAILPFVKQIFVDIGDDQSIEASLSTFSSHVEKQSYILQNADAHSLVLLDELGSGTDPKEGEYLAVAILHELAKKGAIIIATTHFHKLKLYAFEHENVLISSVGFDMDQMRPTYVYQEGRSGNSHAFEIAQRHRMPESVLYYAKQLQQEDLKPQDAMNQKLEDELAKMEQKQASLEEEAFQLHLQKQQLQKEQAEFEKQKEHKLQEICEKYQQELQQIKAEALQIATQLKQANSNLKPHEISQLQHQIQTLEIQEKEEEVKSFQVHDYVCIVSLQYYGEIVEIKRQEALVLVNGLKMKVKLKDLRPATRINQKKVKEKAYHYEKGTTSFSMELNVISYRVEEALAMVGKYLDQALLQKAPSVRIVHGVGTLALKNAIHAYLKKQTFVKSFHIAPQNEGGLGATIVILQ